MTFFGASQEALLAGVLALVALVLGVLGWAAVRNPLLPRLAARNVPRRPGFATLITLGLTLGTVILSTAFTTGDTMSLTVRSVVAGALGTVDEVAFIPGRAPRSGFDLVQAVSTGNFLTALATYFPEADAQRVTDLLRDDPRVAGAAALVLEQARVARDGGGVSQVVNLLGLPDSLPDGFGALRTPAGQAVAVSQLGDGRLYANTEAAAVLGLRVGDCVRLAGLARDADACVEEIVRVGDLGGAPATLFLPLRRLQDLAGHPGQVNQVVVANRGTPAERLRASWPVTARLRAALLDDATAERLYRAFSAPVARQALEAALDRPSTSRQADKLRALLGTLDAGRPTEDFEALVQDPEIFSRLAAAQPGGVRALERGSGGLAGPAGFGGRNAFRVLDVQQVAQDQASRWGAAFTDLFLVLGLFSLFSGVLLVVLIFSLLSLERRGEMGIVRALGGRRTEVVLALALEGALYALLASAVGAAVGVGVALGIVAAAAGVVAEYGFRLEAAVEPASLAISAGAGFLLTFATVTATSWRASRFSIVAAIRGLGEPLRGLPGWRALLAALVPAVVGVALVRLGLERTWSPAYAGGVALVVVGGALVVRWVARRVGLAAAERVVFTLAGALLVAWWYVPVEALRALRLPVYPRALEMAFLGGVATLLGAVWLVAYNVGLLRGVAVGSAGVVWRLTTAYVASHRYRTGMTLAMFGVVVLSLTLGAALLATTDAAYGDGAAVAGGWDVRAEGSGPPVDLEAALQRAGLAADMVSAAGAAATLRVEVIQPGAEDARWRGASLRAVDQAFARGTRARLVAGTDGRSEAAVWQALVERPGTAVVGANLLLGTPGSPRLRGAEDRPFQPFGVWVRDTRAPQAAVRLEVIGVVDGRGPFGSAILAGASSLAAWPPPEQATYYLAVPVGQNVRDVAASVASALPETVASAQPIAEELRLVQGVRALLGLILQGFMGIGLLAGVAALGTISTRAVVERRRQLGVLRALGFNAGMVARGLLAEAGLVAALGSAIGVGVGLLVARGTVDMLALQSPELRLGVPWEQIAMVVALAIGASLLLTLLPASAAARLAPAAALRDE